MASIPDVLKLLLPPAHDATKRHITGWRWAVVVAIFLLLVNGAGGRGWLPFLPAYAQASDVKIILELQYADIIHKQHEQMCSLPTARRAVLRQSIEEYQRRYRELTGSRYPTSPCPQ